MLVEVRWTREEGVGDGKACVTKERHNLPFSLSLRKGKGEAIRKASRDQQSKKRPDIQSRLKRLVNVRLAGD
jgi:hypothetical protein